MTVHSGKGGTTLSGPRWRLRVSLETRLRPDHTSYSSLPGLSFRLTRLGYRRPGAPGGGHGRIEFLRPYSPLNPEPALRGGVEVCSSLETRTPVTRSPLPSRVLNGSRAETTQALQRTFPEEPPVNSHSTSSDLGRSFIGAHPRKSRLSFLLSARRSCTNLGPCPNLIR